MVITAVSTCVVHRGTPKIKITDREGGGVIFFSGSSSSSSLSLVELRCRSLRVGRGVRAEARGRGVRSEAMATEKMGIKIESNPNESRLTELGVREWPKWGCIPSKFPWKYISKETCYLLKGKVKVYPDGYNDDFVEIGAGDLVEFPQGMKCTWEITETVDKHYKFE